MEKLGYGKEFIVNTEIILDCIMVNSGAILDFSEKLETNPLYVHKADSGDGWFNITVLYNAPYDFAQLLYDELRTDLGCVDDFVPSLNEISKYITT